jgi:hypothetical protein
MKIFVVMVLLTAFYTVAAVSAAPVVTAKIVASGPKVDGILDDESWKDAQKYTGFHEVYTCGDAAAKTEVTVCADSSHLYFAFICYDSQPERISARQRQRNASLRYDDNVAVLIDTLHNDKSYYQFTINPLGTQNESIPYGSASNITWRGDWQAASKITETGWTAEIAVPYAMLRYPTDAKTFGLAFTRYNARLDERSMWPNLGISFDFAKSGDLNELNLPNAGLRPTFLPYMVVSAEKGHTASQHGFDLKMELPNGITSLLSQNPDFTNVQDAVSSVDFSYYPERYLADYRPFFVEGSAFFPDSTAFYSRRVGQFDWGMKTFGKVGAHTFGFLDALAIGQSNHFASTYSYDAGRDAGIGFMYAGSSVEQQYKVDPNEPDDSACFSPGVYMQRRSDSGTASVNYRRYMSINSNGYSNGSIDRAGASFSANPGHVGWYLSTSNTSHGYYVRDAYINQTGIYDVSGGVNYSQRPLNSRITNWRTNINIYRSRLEDSSLHDENVSASISVNTSDEYRVRFNWSSGTWLGLTDQTNSLRINWLARHLYGGGGATYLNGKRSGRDYKYFRLDQGIRPMQRLGIGFGYEWSRLGTPGIPETSKLYTVSGNYEITPEQRLGIWAVGRNSDINLCCTFTQTARSGADIYLIYGYPNTTETTYRWAMKIVYPIGR